MKVRDVMTETVVAVTPDTPLKEAAKRMLAHGISGLPVVLDEDRVVGVLSETDILFKERSAPERQGLVDWVLHYGDDPPAAKLGARTAGEAMTAPAITVPPGRSVADVVSISVERGEVTLKGRVETQTVAELIESLARSVPGVVGVVSRLAYPSAAA